MLGKRSDQKRFEAVALPHLDALFGMALRLTQDDDDAEDLVQDTMVKAYRFFHRFQEGTNVKAWLFKVLVNLFYNTYRKNKSIQRLEDEAETNEHHDRFISEASTQAASGDGALLDHLDAGHLQEALGKLSEEFRTPVVLCDVYDFSYKEIAEIVDCPVGTVMSRLHRGRRHLQRHLHDFAVAQGLIRAADSLVAPSSDDDAGATTSLAAYRSRRGRP